MNCTDVQQVLPEIMEGSQNQEFQAHVKSCAECAELVADLELIAREARRLAAFDEPPQRVWVGIAAQLRSEGVIRESEAATHPVLVPSAGRRWNAWWLAPVAAALLAGGAYVLNRPSAAPTVAVQNQTTPTTNQVAKETTPPTVAATQKPEQQQVANAKHTPANVDQGAPFDNAPMALVSNDDQQFLNGISQSAPAMRDTYESQLRAVNAYIHDAESYLQRNPGDEDARQQLMNAYDQKTMLYQMALDHVQ